MVTTEEFIPFNYARTKINHLVSNYLTKSGEAEAYMAKMKEDNDEHFRRSKEHYETIIIDLKAKAKR